MKRSANCFGVMPQAAASAAIALQISRDRSIRLGLMVLREFIRTIFYHKVEIHESEAFERGKR